MPSPTWSTVPTSARSVSTSYSSIRCFRIEVISSGRSFTKSPLLSEPGSTQSLEPPGFSYRCQLAAEPLQTAAHARVEPVGAHLEHDSADQFGVDAAARLDTAPRRALELLQELVRLVVGELDRGRQLRVHHALVLGDQALELAGDLLELAGASLVDQDE